MGSIVPAGQLVWGTQMPIQMHSLSRREEWEPAAPVRELVAVAKAADDAGAFFVGVCDHVALPYDAYTEKMSPTWYDTVATLGYRPYRPRPVAGLGRHCGIPPSAGDLQGVLHARSPVRGPGRARRGRRPRRG